MTRPLLLGAVAYDPKVVTIWEGFRRWFDDQGLPFDFVLYSNYDRQVTDLLEGRIDVAWNSPLAWIRAQRLGQAAATPVRAIAMRDTDRDLTSVVVVRAGSSVQVVGDLAGATVGTGAVDSPQATLIPLDHLRHAGVEVSVRRFEVGVGLHGDHIGGEREAARALVAGEVDAACMIDGNHLLFTSEGTLPVGATRVVAQTGTYDHCNMTVAPDAPDELVARFTDLLLGMDYGDAAVRPLLDLEGLTRWLPGRLEGYALLERAVDANGFYDAEGRSPLTAIDLDDLGFDRGAHLLVERALSSVPVGGRLAVTGRDPHLGIHLAAWARRAGHHVEGTTVVRGPASEARWRDAARAGEAGAAAARAEPTWGLAARGALVESGGPALRVDLVERDEVWAEIVPRLYAQAVASQWDPATAVDWDAPVDLPVDVEAAVVQVMTYLVENEQAALVVPARFLARIHPHHREVVALLAVQVADEARHVEVFTRRALLHGGPMGRSAVSGRASLQTLLDEPDFALAELLLSVLGEGTFLHLLGFLDDHAPDPVTARVAHLALQDEARHVAFGQAHLEHRLSVTPELRGRLRQAIERRHAALASTAGLATEVHDALVVLAAGSFEPAAITSGWDAVQRLQADMDDGRRRRLVRLGFPPLEAAELSALHTRNFM